MQGTHRRIGIISRLTQLSRMIFASVISEASLLFASVCFFTFERNAVSWI